MSQRQVAINRHHGEQSIGPKCLPAPTVHRFTAAPRNSVRFWEWDCFAKYPIITKVLQNSSQFDKLQPISCNFYTQPQGQGRPNHTQYCPILGMGLFRKILSDCYISTQFIIIQHIPAHFVPVIDAPYADR
jgi:hypothetical protein